jgi:hypothetical protein
MRSSKLFSTFLVLVIFLCTCSKKESIVVGIWNAKWTTDPASYPGVDPSVEFTMNGKFEFGQEGNVTISAYGHQGCIFSSDTLVHSLNWDLKNDTILNLLNENDVHGMTYSVLNLSADKMKLQLMEDIFLDLEKI